MLAIDILKKLLAKIFGCPDGWCFFFFGGGGEGGVSKRRRDNLLAKTMVGIDQGSLESSYCYLKFLQVVQRCTGFYTQHLSVAFEDAINKTT